MLRANELGKVQRRDHRIWRRGRHFHGRMIRRLEVYVSCISVNKPARAADGIAPGIVDILQGTARR